MISHDFDNRLKGVTEHGTGSIKELAFKIVWDVIEHVDTYEGDVKEDFKRSLGEFDPDYSNNSSHVENKEKWERPMTEDELEDFIMVMTPNSDILAEGEDVPEVIFSLTEDEKIASEEYDQKCFDQSIIDLEDKLDESHANIDRIGSQLTDILKKIQAAMDDRNDRIKGAFEESLVQLHEDLKSEYEKGVTYE